MNLYVAGWLFLFLVILVLQVNTGRGTITGAAIGAAAAMVMNWACFKMYMFIMGV